MSIQKLRLQRGWSQQHLADASGLSARTIQRIEAGAPASLETLKSLAAVFEVEISTLKPEEQNMNPLPSSSASNQEREAFEHVRMLRNFYLHFAQFLIVNAAFLFANYYWFPTNIVAPVVTICWGAGLLMHACKVWVLGGVWERAQVEKRLGRSL